MNDFRADLFPDNLIVDYCTGIAIAFVYGTALCVVWVIDRVKK